MDEDDDDAETYFAYSNDDLLGSKATGAGNGSEASAAGAGYGPSSTSQVSETSIPNFLLKLWKLVEDDRYNQCIEWDPTGFSFHVREPYGFSKDVLPLYFKHSNLNSFIRQLNMYGFRKVTNLEKGALKQQTDQDSLEFQHPYFVRGHPELLQYIKRKISNPRVGGELDVQQHSNSVRGLNQVLEELRQLRDKQYGMDSKLGNIKKENGTLWREVAHMRQLHMKQQQVVNKLIQFLLSLVQPTAGKRLGKRQLLAIGPGLLAEQDRDEQPTKRLRSDSVSSPSSAVQMIESLEQELQNSARLSYATPASARSSVSGGPIIADVTDEPEHYDIHEQRQQDMAPNYVMQALGSTDMVSIPEAYSQATSMAPDCDDSKRQAPAPVGASFDVLSSSGLGGYKDTDSFVNMSTPSTSVQQKSTSQPQPQHPHPHPHQQQVSAVVQRTQQPPPPPRAILNRCISESEAAAPTAVYNNNDWATGRNGQFSEAEQARWSKPEFSDYLDFVQTDLDSLRDFLTAGTFNVDQDSLSNLFTMADESNTLAANSSQQPAATEIVGNEVQVYKRPELLVNFDGTTTGGGASAVSHQSVVNATSIGGALANSIAASASIPGHHPNLQHQQQRGSVDLGRPAAVDGMHASVLTKPSEGQSVFVAASGAGGSLPQGIVYGIPTTAPSQSNQQLGPGRGKFPSRR